MTEDAMAPLAACALLCLLSAFLAETVETLQCLGTTPANASWWPV